MDGERIERISSIILTIAAVVVAAAVVHRGFFSSDGQKVSSVALQPIRVTNWHNIVEAGILMGDSAAPVKIVEFADFECPFCRKFAGAGRVAQERYGNKVALVFVHLPLTRIHRFAMPAARAAECAAAQDHFAAYYNELYDKQDSLGLKSWTAYARDAGVADTVEFAKCNASVSPFPRIEDGVALAKKLGLTGTPAIFINGWQFPVPPGDSALKTLVAGFLAGADPSMAANN